MKYTVNRAALLAGLEMIADVTGNSRFPQLSHAMVIASPTGISLTANDTEMQIQTRVAAQVTEKGAATLPVRTLIGIVRSFASDAAIQLGSDTNDSTKVVSGRSRFTLTGFAPDEFPLIGAMTPVKKLLLRAQVLTKVLASAKQAMAQSDSRYYLNGVLLEIEGSSITAVGSNGHHMICAKANTDALGERYAVIVPAKGVRAILKALATCEPDTIIDVAMSDTHIDVVAGETTVTSQLVGGTYPDYRQVIPAYRPPLMGEAIVNRDDMIQLVKRVALLAPTGSDFSGGIHLTIQDNEIRASTQQDKGQAVDLIEAECLSGTLDVGINAQLALNALQAIDDDKVRIIFRDTVSAIVMRGMKNEDTVAIVMPMHL